MRQQKTDWILILIGKIMFLVVALGMIYVGGYFSIMILSMVYEEVIEKKNILFLANPHNFINLTLGISIVLVVICIIIYILDSIASMINIIKTSNPTKSKTANLNTDHTRRDRSIKK